VTGSLDHLKETIRPFLDMPDDLRIAKINSDHWIGYGRALAAQDRIHQIQLRNVGSGRTTFSSSARATTGRR
jgi:hypothetical protein